MACKIKKYLILLLILTLTINILYNSFCEVGLLEILAEWIKDEFLKFYSIIR